MMYEVEAFLDFILKINVFLGNKYNMQIDSFYYLLPGNLKIPLKTRRQVSEKYLLILNASQVKILF